MNFQLMNEIATNVCMALQPYKNYLEPYKLKNIKNCYSLIFYVTVFLY